MSYSGNKLHPTQKPVATPKPLIKVFSQERELVLDTFCGSGSTLLAAKILILLFCSIDCLPEQRRPYYFRWYYILAGMMLTSLSAVVINDFIPEQKNETLALEWFGIYTFSLYWIVRTREIKEVQNYQALVRGARTAHAIASVEMLDAPSQNQFFEANYRTRRHVAHYHAQHVLKLDSRSSTER